MAEFMTEYFDPYQRLAIWRREILTRMNRFDELSALPEPNFTNLANENGAYVEVDSFFGTQNVADIASVNQAPVIGLRSQMFGNIAFTSEDVDHPVLDQLRQRYDLVTIAGEGPSFDRVRRVRDWLKSIFPHGIPLTMPAWNALLILDRAHRGVEQFICIHYSVSLVQCCLALGIPARMINVHRGISDSYRIGEEAEAQPPVDEHVVAEVWCQELDKWVMFDTDFDCDYSIGGIPCSSHDIHRAFVEGRADELTYHRGPHSEAFTAYGVPKVGPEAFFQYELPSYYAHVSILMRNDFLANPDGPVPIAHPVDDHTAPILWHRGSDNRLQPHLMGPVVVAQPWSNRTDVLSDGNYSTSWASDESPTEKSVTIRLAGPRLIASGAVHWAVHADVYHTSRDFMVDVLLPNGEWRRVHRASSDDERGLSAFVFEPVVAQALRIVQPVGGGSAAHPHRLWLSQVGVFAP